MRDGTRAVVIPEKLAATSVEWEGDAAREWLERLPGLVLEVADLWDLEVGHPIDPGGNFSWVAPARRRADRLDAVLKLQLPHPESDPEAVALRAWAGGGSVRLFDHDPDRHALLIEACRPGHGVDVLSDPTEAARVGAAIGARLHSVPVPSGLPTLGEVLRPWADDTEAQLEQRPRADPGLARRALRTMRHGTGSTEVVVLHGDLNSTNVLAAEREAWLAIDPKPAVGDPAYDGPRLITQPDPLRTPDPAATLRSRIEAFTSIMGLERDALLEWCLVGAIEMGASAWCRGDADSGQRHDSHVALLAPMLP